MSGSSPEEPSVTTTPGVRPSAVPILSPVEATRPARTSFDAPTGFDFFGLHAPSSRKLGSPPEMITSSSSSMSTSSPAAMANNVLGSTSGVAVPACATRPSSGRCSKLLATAAVAADDVAPPTSPASLVPATMWLTSKIRVATLVASIEAPESQASQSARDAHSTDAKYSPASPRRSEPPSAPSGADHVASSASPHGDGTDIEVCVTTDAAAAWTGRKRTAPTRGPIAWRWPANINVRCLRLVHRADGSWRSSGLNLFWCVQNQARLGIDSGNRVTATNEIERVHRDLGKRRRSERTSIANSSARAGQKMLTLSRT
mmetsp:Transcript_101983/g.287896  ORF Transcript_101983/g.287896 Transcript_101983/m.287896 type:complete len:316 (+) Transcript_101983:246-1193(+)